MTTSYGPPRPRTPRVGERYVVPGWIQDRQGWHDAMDEVTDSLRSALLDQISEWTGVPREDIKASLRLRKMERETQ